MMFCALQSEDFRILQIYALLQKSKYSKDSSNWKVQFEAAATVRDLCSEALQLLDYRSGDFGDFS